MSIEDTVAEAGRRRLLLLDTTVLSARAKAKSPSGLREWLRDSVAVVQFCICFPVLIEIKRGLHLATDPIAAARIRDAIEDIEQSDFTYLAQDRATENVYAEMISNRSLKNFWYPCPNAKKNRISHDLMIAATAIAHGTPIVTTDGDFEVIDRHHKLPGVFNPLRNRWQVEPPIPLELPTLDPTEYVRH